MTWGGCISCEQYFTFGKSHGCCNPDGRCKTKAPGKSSHGRDCTLIAFEHHKAIDLHFDLPVVSVDVESMALSIRTLELLPRRYDPLPVGLSPPDLQTLHSTFLI